MGDRFWQTCLPILVPLGGNIFGKGESLLAAKIGPGDQFFCQNQSGGPIFGGTDFGVTGYLACDPAMVKCM